MDSTVSPKDEIWFLRVYHHISNAVYYGKSSEHRKKNIDDHDDDDDDDKRGAPLLLFLRRVCYNTGQVSASDARKDNTSVYR